ncbi:MULTISPECIES: DegT/DnrJ/EryC1/StrS family aminotransferase [unclassified Micromonospora]|uniref:DegT/DnrJ/EryC1/StrS family aminotransferase n=1 Tax=unclassified Micromonospora TaxID=2617518 RepID=UPI001C236D0F|nr:MULTISPECIES: DegT/DnrJ/EryC1/StrS family aminotransferase [unclassified Micromonospora]MBU8858604.1 DegT/DnrJ/EryC1/StrS family aminotransferase [Micromonospora sp. WMMB482]MDM4784248.1 DegT/DnrJ/EryC1/StrS family aminotransferase [Micromonospora sp. b486]
MTSQETASRTGRLAMLGGERSVPREQRIGQWPRVTEQDEAAVQRALASGRFTSASAGEEEIGALEREWAEFVGTRRCIAVSNGTAALSVALGAVGVRPGDEVIVPALSFVATAMAPMHLLAVPVFVDVDPVSYNLDARAVEAAITARTRAVVVVHLHGLPADMTELREVAGRHGIALVEDAAQAHGAVYRGRQVGGLGDVASFSLNVSKNLATCGEGGLVTTDDVRAADRARMLRQFGESIPDKSERSYVSHVLGWNHKPNSLQAAFTRSQLTRFPEEFRRRDENVRRFLGRIAELPGLTPPQPPGDRTHAWHILRVRVDTAAFGLPDTMTGPLRAAVQRALRAEGVPAAPYQLMPLPAQPAFRYGRGFGDHPWPSRLPQYDPTAFPHTLRVLEETFTIQKAHLHPDAGPLLERYADAFEKVWEHRALVRDYAAGLRYAPPWEQAERIARQEWTAVSR